MYYYNTTANPCSYPYTWTTTSGTSSTSYTYKPNITYDCSGWITHVSKKPKGLDADKITEDAIMHLLKDGEK